MTTCWEQPWCELTVAQTPLSPSGNASALHMVDIEESLQSHGCIWCLLGCPYSLRQPCGAGGDHRGLCKTPSWVRKGTSKLLKWHKMPVCAIELDTCCWSRVILWFSPSVLQICLHQGLRSLCWDSVTNTDSQWGACFVVGYLGDFRLLDAQVRRQTLKLKCLNIDLIPSFGHYDDEWLQKPLNIVFSGHFVW